MDPGISQNSTKTMVVLNFNWMLPAMQFAVAM